MNFYFKIHKTECQMHCNLYFLDEKANSSALYFHKFLDSSLHYYTFYKEKEKVKKK